jgi:hypothetical protein
MKKQVVIPYDFVLNELDQADPIIKPMFGCHAVYVHGKIVLILRNKPSAQRDNGVWLATTEEHHKSLKRDFPGMRSIGVFGDKSGWQIIPADADDFEESALKACGFILKNDPRIGKITKPKTKKVKR